MLKNLEIFEKQIILIHLDEKWLDINDIKVNLYEELVILQKKLKKKIIITSFKNSLDYFTYFKKLKRKNTNIIIFEDTIIIMERMINYSKFAVSCHCLSSTSLWANQSKIIDIINKKDLVWYSCWVPKILFTNLCLNLTKEEISG